MLYRMITTDGACVICDRYDTNVYYNALLVKPSCSDESAMNAYETVFQLNKKLIGSKPKHIKKLQATEYVIRYIDRKDGRTSILIPDGKKKKEYGVFIKNGILLKRVFTSKTLAGAKRKLKELIN